MAIKGFLETPRRCFIQDGTDNAPAAGEGTSGVEVGKEAAKSKAEEDVIDPDNREAIASAPFLRVALRLSA